MKRKIFGWSSKKDSGIKVVIGNKKCNYENCEKHAVGYFHGKPYCSKHFLEKRREFKSKLNKDKLK